MEWALFTFDLKKQPLKLYEEIWNYEQWQHVAYSFDRRMEKIA